MKRYLSVAAIFVLVVASAGMLFRQEARQDTYNEIQLEMAKSEVRQVLGGPLAKPDRTRQLRWGGFEEIWLGRDGAILVVYNKKGVLCYKEWIEPEAMIYISSQ